MAGLLDAGDSCDLLGITAPEQPVAPPAAWKAEAAETAVAEVPESAVNTVPDESAAATADERRFLVRCEGRWRVRSAPSLSSKVVGTVANGTIVVADEEYEEHEEPSGMAPSGTAVATSSAEPHMANFRCLWLRVRRLEAQEPMGVSELKRDYSSGGALFCLRRNALGYGLYEIGVEPQQGALLTLPEDLSAELRSDAQKAAADRSEDVSMTWKILEAAEQVGRFWTTMSGGIDEGGVSTALKPQGKRRPEELFEVRQREQLRKAAGTLKKAAQKIIAKAPADGPSDLTAGLPKEVGRRFSRLRAGMFATASAVPLVVSTSEASRVRSVSEVKQYNPKNYPEPEGDVADLERFVELCGRMEKTSGWPELSTELRQEVTAFSLKHARDLEEHARRLGKGAAGVDRKISMDSTTSNAGGQGAAMDTPPQSRIGSVSGTPTLEAAAARPAPAAAAAPMVPLLPPPPPPSNGLGAGRLI